MIISFHKFLLVLQQIPHNINNKETKDFLQSVKQKFSDVLIPVDNITKQDLLGKGNFLYQSCMQNVHIALGAFGVVFKGDLQLSDGSMVPVAIKTIACMSVSVCLQSSCLVHLLQVDQS